MRLIKALKTAVPKFEIIAVNDGSRDGSVQELRRVARQHPELKIIDLCRNYDQTAALMAGIEHASGDTIVSIDADLQNDPEDIPELLAKPHEGMMLCPAGGKIVEIPAYTQNTQPSRQSMISLISGVKLKDYGCTLKAYRRQDLEGHAIVWRDASIRSYRR
jgi:glycosyltransferase involved in cell wall biosynthesis